MELLCPECLGPLALSGEDKARCTIHGGEYQVLFQRAAQSRTPATSSASPSESALNAPPVVQRLPAAEAVCGTHPAVRAVVACQDCARPLCQTCACLGADGSLRCPECTLLRSHASPEAQPIGSSPPPSPIAAGMYCVQHPLVQATVQCQSCGAFMCATCDFVLAGGVHVCPPCATTPRSKLSARRRRLLYGSYGLAVFASFVLTTIMAGTFEDLAEKPQGAEALGVLFFVFCMIPATVGMGLGLSARDRRLANPPVLWVAIAWNSLIVGFFLLACIVGMISD